MDTWRVEPLLDRPSRRLAGVARFGAAGLSLRLASLRRSIERDYPMALALDIADRDAADGLPPALTDAVHALLHEAALNAARHAGAALLRLSVHVNGGAVELGAADDGTGFPFIGVYDLPTLMSLGAGPRWLVRQLAALGGSLILDSRESGSRIAMTVPREAAPRCEAEAAPVLAAE